MLDFTGLNFNSLSAVANVGAGDRINDLQFLERELKKWLNSKERKLMLEGDCYYNYEQFINSKQRTVIVEGGEHAVDKNLPNNKFLDNQYSSVVDQKVNYLLSQPVAFKTENEAYADALNEVFNKKFHRLFKNLGKASYNHGISWIYPYYNERGEFTFRKFNGHEILPFWKDDDHLELDFAVRYYEMLGYMGKTEHVYKFVEVYDTKGIHRFNYENGALNPDYQTYYFDMPNLEGEIIPYNWDKVPLIPFKSNTYETPLLKKCKTLQDGINQIMSDFGDSMQENASGNSILVITNYDGTDLGEFRRNLAQYRAVKLRNINGENSGLSALQIEVNSQNYLTILQELRKALILNCRGYDTNDLKSAGSPNEMTIKSIFSQIDLDANETETEFQASFEDLLWFVNQHLANIGVGSFDGEKIDIIFNRDMMVNQSQVIADIVACTGLISEKTALSQLSFIDDVDAEMEQKKKERDEAMEEAIGNAEIMKPDLMGEEDEDK